MMLTVGEKVEMYFEDAVSEIQMSTCRLNWNLTASGHEIISKAFPRIQETNELFDDYVKMHVKQQLYSEVIRGVLCDVCYSSE